MFNLTAEQLKTVPRSQIRTAIAALALAGRISNFDDMNVDNINIREVADKPTPDAPLSEYDELGFGRVPNEFGGLPVKALDDAINRDLRSDDRATVEFAAAMKERELTIVMPAFAYVERINDDDGYDHLTEDQFQHVTYDDWMARTQSFFLGGTSGRSVAEYRHYPIYENDDGNWVMEQGKHSPSYPQNTLIVREPGDQISNILDPVEDIKELIALIEDWYRNQRYLALRDYGPSWDDQVK